MPEKRPHPEDGTDVANGHKRPRSNNASPAPPSNGVSKKKPDLNAQIAAARAKAAEIKARLSAKNAGPASPSPAPPSVAAPFDRAKTLEDIRARIAAATAKKAATAEPPPRAGSSRFPPPNDFDEGPSRARGGLGIGLHPALMGDVGADRSKSRSMHPKFATTSGNRRTESPLRRQQLDLAGPNVEELKSNPYMDPNLSLMPRGRVPKNLVFNQKGKYIQQGNALRRQAALEEMKKRIAEQARKVGLDEDNDKSFLIQAPPEIEWWDEALVDGTDYTGVEDSKNLKIDTEDSIITRYIQHPVLIEPPQEKNAPAPKPMFLTQKEMAKKRRQTRMAIHKEQQAKIRLGLEPPPPPKVKKSNLMRVLGEQAVKDPTAVEARVNSEIAERAAQHDEDNESRKLTKEERHQKLAEQQEKDALKGVLIAVFRIENLSYGKHRYQIDINAKQNDLTGMTILHPKFNIVIVEGGAHSIRNYKKLLLNRIKWTENAAPASVREGNREVEKEWLKSVADSGELKDLSFNKCTLVWEGQEKERKFKKWGSKVCETDVDAKDALTRFKMENFWTLAKSLGQADGFEG
ncbi:PRP3-domain-containing protein [Eremomyces bilateralis CBS 781.70]|uniref:PRP3-domain-containing protein n=1 Tax=Eremomyces bilateralis CBS 781.70 TaxID=1392243 RepID=A0A6G1FYJ2_9PEZI|nr:PRP3-domain-containing protein [Eremomyces bilateralis CBS 781.70]KAF1810844.1 PRP3-domain-containing protein [Eremomyces bilateralis CBS 781.70]